MHFRVWLEYRNDRSVRSVHLGMRLQYWNLGRSGRPVFRMMVVIVAAAVLLGLSWR